MANRKKKSSYTGYIGAAYFKDARAFKDPIQRERVKKNLDSPEGLQRLLKNSNPIYWALAMGEVMDHQRDYRWIGYNRILEGQPALVNTLTHRIVHTLRLDDKKYYGEKLFAVTLMAYCELYHHKFLEDYILFYQNMDHYLQTWQLSEKDDAISELKGISIYSIDERTELILRVINNLLASWDQQYTYPDRVTEFFEEASQKISTYHAYGLNRTYHTNLFKLEYLLKSIHYHQASSNIQHHETVISQVLPTIDFDALQQKYEAFLLALQDDVEEKSEEITIAKTDLYDVLLPLKDVISSFLLLQEFNETICLPIFQKYQDTLNQILNFSKLLDTYRITKKPLPQWQYRSDVPDHLLHLLMNFIERSPLSYSIYELEEELELQRALTINSEIIRQLLTTTNDAFDIPFSFEEDDLDEYLEIKYLSEAQQQGHIQAKKLNRSTMWLQVEDPTSLSQELLADFHLKTEEEKSRSLELLYLAGATVPHAAFLTNEYQFQLITQIIAHHWPKKAYLNFLQEQLEVTNTFKRCVLFRSSTLRAYKESTAILGILQHFWDISHPLQARKELFDAIEYLAEKTWWTQNRLSFLTNWIMQESNEELKQKLRAYYRANKA